MVNPFRKTLQIYQYPSGMYVKGVWQPGAPVAGTITASVQPLKEVDLKALPQGRAFGDSYKIFTDSDLYVTREGSARNSDVVVVQDERYEVVASMPWQNGVINHNAYLISREQVGK